MPRATPILTSFAGGELSPLLGGRTDLGRYFVSCAVMENFIALPQGPALRRPGTVFVGHSRQDRSLRVRLVPFVFGANDAYVLELTDQRLRVWRQRGEVLAGDQPYELATPWREEHLAGLQWAQSGDVLIVTHPNLAPQKLARYAHDDWRVSPLQTLDGPYAPAGAAGIRVTPSELRGSVSLVADSDIFHSAMVGQPFRLQRQWIENETTQTGWRWLRITAVTDARHATGDVQGEDLKNLDASDQWREPAWSDARGWPRALCYHEQRLFFAGSTAQPQSLWASRSGLYEDFGVSDEVADDDALSYTIAANQVNAILWLRSATTLLAGTSAGEWAIAGSTASEALTPTSVAVRQQSSHGSAPVAPVQIGKSVLFVQRGGVKLRELSFSFQEDGYVAPDLTVQAEHVLRPGGVAEMAWQAAPHAVLWLCLNPNPGTQEGGGELVGLTYEKDQQVYGFHRHPTGPPDARLGPIGGSGNLHRVESLCVIPTPDGTDDDLWLVVRRPLGSQGFRRCIEIVRGDGERVEVDCALHARFDAAVSEVAGLEHLDGESVRITADGGTEPVQIVRNGRVSLGLPARQVAVGLPYVSRLVTQRIEAGAADGTAQGRRKLVGKLRARFLGSRGGRYGVPGGRLDPLPTRDSAVGFGQAAGLFSGDVELTMPGGWDRAGQVEIRQDLPQPMTLLALMPTVATSD